MALYKINYDEVLEERSRVLRLNPKEKLILANTERIAVILLLSEYKPKRIPIKIKKIKIVDHEFMGEGDIN